MAKRITRATALAAVRKHANHLSVYKLELDQDCIALFGPELEPVAYTLSAELGHCEIQSTGWGFYVWYHRR